jgi:hypothetical protein
MLDSKKFLIDHEINKKLEKREKFVIIKIKI